MDTEKLRKIIEQFPDDPVSNFTLGNRLYEENNQESYSYIKKALDLDPNHIMCYLILGNIHADKGEFNQAKEYYHNGLKQMLIAPPGSGQDLEEDFRDALEGLEF